MADMLSDHFREVMAGVPAPVAIVTVAGEQGNVGATVTAFCSLSMAPPLILVALFNQSATLEALQQVKRFGLNMMGSHQIEICNLFASHREDKFASIDWKMSAGSPRISGSVGWVACNNVQFVPGGDHTIVIGSVTEAEKVGGQKLNYCEHRYQVTQPVGQL